jgi:uncharacterized membrane protein YeaQ/YmgE (transglycosylase-associated protein family)
MCYTIGVVNILSLGGTNYDLVYNRRSYYTNRGEAMGWISNILAGLVGSAIGQAVLGHWGPSLAGMAIIPSIIGAVVLVLIISAIFGMKKG